MSNSVKSSINCILDEMHERTAIMKNEIPYISLTRNSNEKKVVCKESVTGEPDTYRTYYRYYDSFIASVDIEYSSKIHVGDIIRLEGRSRFFEVVSVDVTINQFSISECFLSLIESSCDGKDTPTFIETNLGIQTKEKFLSEIDFEDAIGAIEID